MVPSPYRADWHEVVETPFAKHLRSELRDPLLFTYRHRVTKNWVAAAWIKEEFGMFLELAILGETWQGTQAIVQSIRSMVAASEQGRKNKKRNRHIAKNLEKWFEEDELEDAKHAADVIDFVDKRHKHVTRQFVVNG